MIPATMALAIPDPACPDLDPTVPIDDWFVTGYWRIIWLVPVVVAIIHSIVLICCFNHETPVYLNEMGREEEMLIVLKKFY